jgi:hypothetical protein
MLIFRNFNLDLPYKMLLSSTHLQGRCETLINLALSNDCSIIKSYDVVECPFSNHRFVQLSLDFQIEYIGPSTVEARVLNEKNLEKIHLILENSPDCFKIIDSINDQDIMFDSFRSILVNSLELQLNLVLLEIRLNGLALESSEINVSL